MAQCQLRMSEARRAEFGADAPASGLQGKWAKPTRPGHVPRRMPTANSGGGELHPNHPPTLIRTPLNTDLAFPYNTAHKQASENPRRLLNIQNSKKLNAN